MSLYTLNIKVKGKGEDIFIVSELLRSMRELQGFLPVSVQGEPENFVGIFIDSKRYTHSVYLIKQNEK